MVGGDRLSGPVKIGLAIATIGRPQLAELLLSAAASTHRPSAVALANQSGGPLPVPAELPFPVTVVESQGGASRGRNDAVRALGDTDVLCFPNDDSVLPPTTLAGLADAFASDADAAAVACNYVDVYGPRYSLPLPGTELDRRTVWRAIEPAMALRSSAFTYVGGFREDIGTGAGTPWGSGEGTDLLLRVLERGGRIISRPDLVVTGATEARALSTAALVRKHRAYARGTGLVYREHGYSAGVRALILAGPLAPPTAHHPRASVSLRLAAARVLGRFEGLRGRPLRSYEPWAPRRDEEVQ